MKSKLLMETRIFKALSKEAKKKQLTADELNEIIVKRELKIN